MCPTKSIEPRFLYECLEVMKRNRDRGTYTIPCLCYAVESSTRKISKKNSKQPDPPPLQFFSPPQYWFKKTIVGWGGACAAVRSKSQIHQHSDKQQFIASWFYFPNTFRRFIHLWFPYSPYPALFWTHTNSDTKYYHKTSIRTNITD